MNSEALTESIKLMTIEEVASLLHYSIKTVYKKAAKGEKPQEKTPKSEDPRGGKKSGQEAT